MNPDLFERLLHEDEGVTLDFKVGQYAFAGADAQQKSELLKDILGFVNAWRRAEAYILIGVREIRGSRSHVVGITAHEQLDDHSLQQFVNNKTNRPVRFSYEAFSFEGKSIGIIGIEEQERPVWLTNSYGKLKKDEVYVRRGSSTDPNKPATPDEIVKMVQASAPQAATLEVQFANVENDVPIGTSIQIKEGFVEFPPEDDIPSLRPRPTHLPPQFATIANFSLETLNPDYYRKAAVFAHHQCNFHPLRFVIANCGEVPAEDVRLELQMTSSPGIEILEESQLKTRFPERSRSRLQVVSSLSEHLGAARHRVFDGVVDVTRDSAFIKIEVEYGKIQPGRRVWTDRLFVACKESGTVKMTGQVFSKHVPKPIVIELSIEFDVSVREAGLERFLEWADDPTNMEEE